MVRKMALAADKAKKRKLAAELNKALEQPDTNARYFTVRFKDGTVRGVMPDDDDPLQFKTMIFGSQGKLERIEPGKRAEPFKGDEDLEELASEALGA
jgi:hypothetical protein